MDPKQMTTGEVNMNQAVMPEKKIPQWLVVLILIVAVIAIAGGVTLLKKSPTESGRSEKEQAIIDALQAAPVKQVTPEQRETIMKQLATPPKKILTDEERQKILEALKKK